MTQAETERGKVGDRDEDRDRDRDKWIETVLVIFFFVLFISTRLVSTKGDRDRDKS